MRRTPTILVAVAAFAAAIVLAGCAAGTRPSVPVSPSNPQPSATAAPTPGPSSTAGPSTNGPATLPGDAARRWAMPTDPALEIDLGTPGRIVVRAGCLGFTGDLETTAAPDDPAAGAPAGPTVSIAITPRDDGRVRCLGFSAEQQEFVTALRGSSVLTVVGDQLYLSGPDAALELAPAS